MFGKIEELEILAKEVLNLVERDRFLTYLLIHLPDEEIRKYAEQYRKEKEKMSK